SKAERDLFKATEEAVQGLPARMGPKDSNVAADLLKKGQYAQALKTVEAKAEERPEILPFYSEELADAPLPEAALAPPPPAAGARGRGPRARRGEGTAFDAEPDAAQEAPDREGCAGHLCRGRGGARREGVLRR